MAKWGQGDLRWIVEEREDGTNVNNWHWCGRRGGATGGGLLPGSGEGRPAGAGTALGSVRGRRVAGVRGLGGHAPPSAAGRRFRPPPGLGSVLGTERDATSWSKGKFQELLVGIVVENDVGRGEISELKQVEGEASCSSRKGKLIFFYEWYIKLGWKGIVKESGVKHKGLIEIPSLSEEN